MNPFVMSLLRFAGTALILALVAGCGPTGGGTGTGDGPLPLSTFGAQSSSSCSAPFAGQLACASTALAPTDAALLAGTAPVEFTGSAAQGPFTLRLQGQIAELLSSCRAARFDGEWGVLPNGDGRYFGTWVGVDGGTARPARLSLQPLSDGLLATVQDAEGRQTLFGPLAMQRRGAPAGEAPRCPDTGSRSKSGDL